MLDLSDIWLQTSTGLAIHPFAPSADQISLRDIAHHLSLEPRFAGATRFHYSVAQHVCLVVEAMRKAGYGPRAQRLAMMHDSGEYVLKDTPRPTKEALKRIAGSIRELSAGVLPDSRIVAKKIADQAAFMVERLSCAEHELMRVILKKYNVEESAGLWEAVKKFDDSILFVERAELMANSEKKWNSTIKRSIGAEMFGAIAEMDPRSAERWFLNLARDLEIFDPVPSAGEPGLPSASGAGFARIPAKPAPEAAAPKVGPRVALHETAPEDAGARPSGFRKEAFHETDDGPEIECLKSKLKESEELSERQFAVILELRKTRSALLRSSVESDDRETELKEKVRNLEAKLAEALNGSRTAVIADMKQRIDSFEKTEASLERTIATMERIDAKRSVLEAELNLEIESLRARLAELDAKYSTARNYYAEICQDNKRLEKRLDDSQEANSRLCDALRRIARTASASIGEADFAEGPGEDVPADSEDPTDP